MINGSFGLTNSIAGNSQSYSLRVISRLPSGWTYSVNNGQQTLELFGNQTVNIPVQITPAPAPVGELYNLQADAVTLLSLSNNGSTHPSWFVAGGVSLNAHTVLPSQIAVAASSPDNPNAAPKVLVQGKLTPGVDGTIVTVDLYSTVITNVYSVQLTVGPGGTFSATLAPPFQPTDVRAIWQGDMLNESAVASAAVLTEAATGTSLTSSLNPSNASANVKFTATVAHGGSGTPTGTVTFRDGAKVLGNVALASDKAAFSTSTLAVGNHSITAAYSGDFFFVGSVSTPLTQTVK